MKTNSFSYYIWLSTVQFCHEFKINVILIVSMALGLLFPIFCLGNINVFVQNIKTMRIQGEQIQPCLLYMAKMSHFRMFKELYKT